MSKNAPSNMVNDIREHAMALGFDTLGVAPARLPDETGANLTAFLAQERHGEMDWLETRANQRAQPRTLWPEARSVIMLGANYGPETDPLEILQDRQSGAISVYAQNKDYHDVLKKRLKALARYIVERTDADVKVFVDTAPVMEKPLAGLAGLGWQGKHTNLVSLDYGSWLFLGAIFTTLTLPTDTPEPDHCGSCRACLDICPTDAFPAPYQLDARRCISYLTIEHRGSIPHEFREAMGNRIYGCDDCLAVCPWNKFAQSARESAFQAREELRAPSLGDLVDLNDADFRALFTKSPVKRTGRDRFLRNVLIAIGNSNDKKLVQQVRARLTDESPLVRGAAVWAFAKLTSENDFSRAKAQNAPAETDESVLQEWSAGLKISRQ